LEEVLGGATFDRAVFVFGEEKNRERVHRRVNRVAAEGAEKRREV
jgi:hypothetical protein